MKIVSWNVNGLRSAISKNFGGMLEAEKPDIFCLQETRVDELKASALDLPFKYRYFHPATKAGYSGTAIFSNIEPIAVERISFESEASEGRAIRADFGKFALTSIYAPNSQDELKRIEFKHAWNMNFAKYFANSKNEIVCGDFNVAHQEIDLARPKENRESAGFSQRERDDFTKILSDCDMVDIWRERNPDTIKYSWWSFRFGARKKNIGWRIDYFLVSRNILQEVKSTDILDKIEGSDHAPLQLVLKDA